MTIEEAIKQKKFENAQHRAHVNLMFTANWLIDQTKAALKPFGLTPQQFNVLRILRGRHPEQCSSADIKEVMVDKGPDLTRLIDRLIVKEFVTRNVCSENRRKMDIAISEKGLELLKKLDAHLGQRFKNRSSITDAEANELCGILDKMRENKYNN